MRYLLSQLQVEALAQWHKDEEPNIPDDGVSGDLAMEIYGDEDIVGGNPQFKWNGLYLHRNGRFEEEPENDGWVSVQGTVIGWLAPDESKDVDVDVAVVRSADGSIWLRWIGNDIFTTRDGHEVNDEIKVGDQVSFSTNREEQEGYADSGVDPAVEENPQPGDVVTYTDPDGITWTGTLFSGVTTGFDEMEARVIWHAGHEPEDEFVNYEELKPAPRKS